MDGSTGRDVVRRWTDNPIIAIEDVPFRCGDIWNAGVARLDGQYVLLITIETLRGLTQIHLARSRDGTHFTVQDEPFMASATVGPLAKYENRGVRDPRITRVDGA